MKGRKVLIVNLNTVIMEVKGQESLIVFSKHQFFFGT